MRKTWLTVIAITAAFPIAMAQGAAAQSLKKDATFSDWSVFILEEDGKRTCYAATPALAFRPTDNLRSQPFLYVTRYPGATRVNKIEIRFGMDASGFGALNVKVIARRVPPKSNYSLKANGRTAVVAADADQTNLLAVIPKGRALRVTPVAAADDDKSGLRDIYSLFGVTKALKHLEKLCP